MTERPEAFRNRGGQSMQDSGVGSFGSESDSSPVQQNSALAPSKSKDSLNSGSASSGHEGHANDGTGSKSNKPVHSQHRRPTITVIPQSPLEATTTFNFEKMSNTDPKDITPTKPMLVGPSVGSPTSKGKTFQVTYFGESILDRRYTRPMLPWIMAEIRRNPIKHDIVLQIVPSTHLLQAAICDSNRVLFEHKLQTVSSFARSQQDPKCFVYLTRANPDSSFCCHVFQTSDESKVRELFTAIREATKEAVRDTNSQNHSPDGAAGEPSNVSASHLCEVMYVGKVVVTSKKAPPTFIDEAVEKFSEHDRQKSDFEEQERQRHSSGSSVQSLPADLEHAVAVRENELGVQTPKANSSDSYINLSEDDTEGVDNIPLGGSSGSLLLGSSLKALHTNRRVSLETSHPPQTKRRVSLETSHPHHSSDLHLVTNSQDSIKNTLIQHMGQGDWLTPGSDLDNLQKLVLQNQSQAKKNRTMLIQVGQHDICLISTDRKKVIFERKFTDISFCSQGIQHPEHFGFISRDAVNNNFMCYVFRCATESLVEEVMQTLKQAFHAAYQQSARNHVVCELCPMHQLHKLCQELDKQPAERVHELLMRRVDGLGEKDRYGVMEDYKTTYGQTLQEKNETLMSILRHMAEDKQREHSHISDTNRAKYEFVLVDLAPEYQGYHAHSKFDQFKNKAKKSLTTSFENILHRKHIAFSVMESSMGTTPDTTPLNSPVIRDFHDQFPTPYLDKDMRPTPFPRRVRSKSTSTPPTYTIEERNDSSERYSNMYGYRIHGPQGDTVKDDLMKFFGETTSPIKSMFSRVTSSMHPNSLSPPSPSPSSNTDRHSLSSLGAGSWRMDILNRVVTPASTPKKCTREYHHSNEDPLAKSEELLSRRQRWRHLWKKAILETLLLIRMERENKSLQGYASYCARQDEVETRRLKLDYEEITPCLKEVTKVWERMLQSPVRNYVKFEQQQLADAVKDGLPRAKRGDIWQLLVQQHRLHNPQLQNMDDPQPVMPYEDLLKQLTTHQHAILIDLGRTFPGHPYFTTQLGPGQLALFNLLKAYSLLDKEVGYCQGLSFVAGILLMHMPEEMAFRTLRYMMKQMGFRRQYRPDMVALQIELYQLSRLLHDYQRDLYEHLEQHDIAPTLYAAPWFLTIFASQFPLGFVARVFDLIFLQGLEVVFKVALVLLGNHKELIKQCDSFETIMEFLKTTLPSMGIIQMERVINQVFQMDLSMQLHAYEVEYHVLQEEMLTTPHRGENDVIGRLEQANHNLKRQNLELLEQLQTARSQSHSMENQMHNVLTNQNKLKSHIRTLELERAALLNAVSKLRKLVPDEIMEAANVNIPPINADKTITNSPIHNPLVNRFLEDLDLKFTSSSLTEVDKEVAALMQAKHRKLSDQGVGNHQVKTHLSITKSNEFLTVDAAHGLGRPASSNY